VHPRQIGRQNPFVTSEFRHWRRHTHTQRHRSRLEKIGGFNINFDSAHLDVHAPNLAKTE